tara:strand:+ start:805 stop:1005 length:201 start_codon:yes stop_codon:yes gene_type:complete
MAEGDVTVTVTFSEAQWTRIKAASAWLKPVGDDTTITADYLATAWKNQLAQDVKAYEQSQASIDDF